MAKMAISVFLMVPGVFSVRSCWFFHQMAWFDPLNNSGGVPFDFFDFTYLSIPPTFVLWGYSQSFNSGVTIQLLERQSAPYFIRKGQRHPLGLQAPSWTTNGLKDVLCKSRFDEKLCETDCSGRVPWNLVSSRNCFLILNPGLVVHLWVKVSLGTRMAWGIHKAIGWSGSSGGPSTPSLPVKVVLTRRRAACLHCFHCVTFLDDLLLTEARGHYKAKFNWR